MRRRNEIEERGPPFVEIEGVLYLNVAFDLAPIALDPRAALAEKGGEDRADLCILLRLRYAEAQLVRRYRDDSETEAWARVSVMVAKRRRRKRS